MKHFWGFFDSNYEMSRVQKVSRLFSKLKIYLGLRFEDTEDIKKKDVGAATHHFSFKSGKFTGINLLNTKETILKVFVLVYIA